MTETRHKNTAMQVISDVFSPVLVPTYCMIMAMWLTPLNVLPERNRLIVTAIVALITSAVPTAVLLTLMRLGKISDRAISDRSERTVPLAITTLCYLSAAAYLRSVHAPAWLPMFFIAASVSSLSALFISRHWKISAHGIASGGMTGMVAWLVCHDAVDTNSVAWLSATIVTAGTIGTSRLILRRHTPAQVFVGLVLGAAVAFGMMFISI